MMTKTIALLGATGSIGRQTLEVARELGIPALHMPLDALERSNRSWIIFFKR